MHEAFCAHSGVGSVIMVFPTVTNARRFTSCQSSDVGTRNNVILGSTMSRPPFPTKQNILSCNDHLATVQIKPRRYGYYRACRRTAHTVAIYPYRDLWVAVRGLRIGPARLCVDGIRIVSWGSPPYSGYSGISAQIEIHSRIIFPPCHCLLRHMRIRP